VSIHQVGTFVSNVGGLFFQAWAPEAPRATVVIAHGYAEHSARYEHVGRALAERGYAAYAYDQQGHGRSAGVRAHVARFGDFVDDLATFVQLVRERQPGGPLFLLGHSLGGLVAALYAIDRQRDLAGLVLSAPFFASADRAPAALLAVAPLVSAIAPTLAMAPFDSSGISRDPAVVRAYTSDPLVYTGRVRARFGHEFLTAAASVLPRASQLALPLLVMQGDADRIASVAAAEAIFRAAASPDKRIRHYPGLYHEIFNEPERDQVTADLLAWLDAR
jgi:alpha-beta hydrolase superfamily lysophospholipase